MVPIWVHDTRQGAQSHMCQEPTGLRAEAGAVLWRQRQLRGRREGAAYGGEEGSGGHTSVGKLPVSWFPSPRLTCSNESRKPISVGKLPVRPLSSNSMRPAPV